MNSEVLNLSSTREFISQLMKGDYSATYVLNLIYSHYKNESLLNSFIKEYIDELWFIQLELMWCLTNKDILNLIRCAQKPLTIYKLDELAYNQGKAFIREIEGHTVISNARGLKNCENPVIEVIFLDDIVKEMFGILCFSSNLSVCEKFKGFDLICEVEARLISLLPQQATESAPQEKPFEFENKFDHVKENIVYDYFKSSLVDTNLITLDELHKFLKSAFQDRKNVDKLTFKNKPTKQKVIKIFHKYYSETASKPHGEKEAYVSLLCNYFEGYTQRNVSSNFSK